jgi:ankyrin repeat protein
LAGLENQIQKGASVDTTIHLRTLAFEDILTRGPSLLCIAAFFGSRDCFRFLLGNGADTLVLDDFRRNVTHFACSGGSLEILGLLSQSAVSFTAPDTEGNTCVHYAIMYHRPAVVFWLWAAYGADLAILNNRRMSPLHVAVMCENDCLIGFLAQNGCDINGKTDEGRTPAHIAASKPNVKVLEAVLRCGADLSLSDNNGCLPYHWARFGKHQHIQRLLLDSGPALDLLTKAW